MGQFLKIGDDINFRRLKYFVKIVGVGNLTQAAEILHIAQPASSQQVAALGDELDRQLLIRIKRGVTLTDAGRIFYTHAWAILHQCKQAQLAVHNVGRALSGQVSTGFASGTIAPSITIPLLQAVRAKFPEIVIYPHENSDAVLNEKLINHQLDMAVIYEHSPVAGVSGQALLKEDPFLIGTQDCPGQSVDVNAVAQMGLFPPGDYGAIRLRIDETFFLRRLTAKVIDEVESIATPTAAIASGMGVTVLSESTARSLCDAINGQMSHIATPSMNLSLSLSLPTRTNLSPQAQAVKELLMSVISSPVMEKRQWQLVS